MALIVFLRGVNVGGHRTFRPSVLAKDLRAYNVVNVGAAGTFVVRKPGSRAKFCTVLRRRLPFETAVVVCYERELLRIEEENPFKNYQKGRDIVRFVSVFSRSGRIPGPIPASLPSTGKWFVKLLASDKQFVFGIYRRHMKTIGYLGQVDKMFGALATTRNWNTITTVLDILKNQK